MPGGFGHKYDNGGEMLFFFLLLVILFILFDGFFDS